MKHERTNFTCPVCNKPFSLRTKALAGCSADETKKFRCRECMLKGYATKEDKDRGTK